MHSALSNGLVYQDADQPSRRGSGGCMALLTLLLDATQTTKDQLDSIRKKEQTFIQHC